MGVLSQSELRLPLLQVVRNNKSFSVGVQSPTEINAPRGCAVILRRICQLSLTRITHQVSRVFDLKYIEPQWHGSYLISTDNTVATAASFIAARFLAGNCDQSGCDCANRSFCHSGTVRNRFPLYFLEHCHESDGNISQHIDRKCEHIADFSVPCHMDMFPLS